MSNFEGRAASGRLWLTNKDDRELDAEVIVEAGAVDEPDDE